MITSTPIHESPATFTKRPGRALACVATLLAMTITACFGERSSHPEGRGTVVISTAADADNLFPPLVGTTLGRVITEQLFEPLADLGDSLNVIGDRGFVPRLADSWKWAPDSLSIEFHLNPRARWHDGVPVRASDVRFTHLLYSSPDLGSPGARMLADIDSVTVRDSLTATAWFRRRSPEQFYIVATEMLVMPEHVYGRIPPGSLGTSDLMRSPVGSGRFRFARWVPGATIEITANTAHYRAPAGVDRVVWTVAPDFTAAATRFLTGEADFFEAVRADMIPKVEHSPRLRVAEFPSFKSGFLTFNLRDPKQLASPHPVFGSRGVRRALTMAIDRATLARSVFDTLASPAIGPMVRAMPTADTLLIHQIPYDPAGAMRLLDSLGWRDSNGDGVRERRGIPLAFTIMTPASSKDRERLAVLLQDQLKRIGARVTVQPTELNVFVGQLGTRNFDAAMETWQLDPNPSAITESWSSASARAKGSGNHSGYASQRFDAELHDAAVATSLETARAMFARAYQTIIDDAPAVWLFEPRNVVGLDRRIDVGRFRSDAWWAHMADWSIPRDARTERDRLPPQAGVQRDGRTATLGN